MTKDEALTLALEALTNELACDRTNNADDDAAAEQMYDAIAAIKEALAQPEQEQTRDIGVEQDERVFARIAAMKKPPQRQPQPEQEPVAFITPLMEQQMFDDWCPYKGSPDPRTVWAAAVDSVNGLLLGASPPPPQRQPLTDEQRMIEMVDAAMIATRNIVPRITRSQCRLIIDATEAAHKIGATK